jgi:hypothetical protein
VSKLPKRPRDPNQLAKLIVDIATGEATDEPMPETGKKSAAGRAGGLKGGAARAAALSDRQRKQIAKKAAAARWGRRPK